MAHDILPAHRRPRPPCGAAIGLVWLSVAGPALSVHAQTQTDMNLAASKRFAAADATLNAHYARLVAKLSPQGKDALRTAQRSWLQFRDQECAFETMGSLGGSLHPMVVAECETRVTETRVAELDRELNCQEGDAACGNQ